MSKSKKDIEIENIQRAQLAADGQFRGYQFQQDSMANQMAYLFGGKDGESKAQAIIKEANDKYPDLLQAPDKKRFIESKVRERANEVDKGFQAGLIDTFKNLQSQGKSDCKGDDAGKQSMLGVMKGLGLNVDDDNVQTNYSPGPPMVMQITWKNRPTENLKDENSFINELSQCYGETLDQTQKDTFDKQWEQHTENAKIDGPKDEKSTFLSEADKYFEEKKHQLKNPEQQRSAPEEKEIPTNRGPQPH